MRSERANRKNVVGEGEGNLFSILTGARNNSKYLNQYASSILAQSYRPLEVIYVDDCSIDKSANQIESMRGRFDDNGIALKVIRNPRRQFCSSSYRVALENSSGWWLGVLDGDDMLTKDAVEYIVNLYRRHPAIDWIYTQFDMYNAKMSKRLKKGFSKAPSSRKGQSLLDLGKKRVHAYSHWRTFCRRVPNINKLFKPGLRAAVDKHMGYRLEEQSKGMFVDRVCYLYRQSVPGCISKTEKARKIWGEVVNEAISRRRSKKYRPFPIKVCQE